MSGLLAFAVLPVMSLLIFLSLFLALVAWLVFTPSARWMRDARIPLEEPPVEPRTPENHA